MLGSGQMVHRTFLSLTSDHLKQAGMGWVAQVGCFGASCTMSLFYQQDISSAAAQSKRQHLDAFLLDSGRRFSNKNSQRPHLIICTVGENYCTT